ncbi:hypothetical protein L211DRAFT_845059 [Terfezia boudieri ATCC MYA-4762]|uniref:Uncharacterized protein n=1 Tax=Terfezia boudieri ATCC MYA-4762 TaxID=1051890 RepID=A0A3N4M1V4_9PEZI|nr:hypothetical protein L211DRAFT_845059 [Terfezia boudieri ATCC MYA-4762]
MTLSISHAHASLLTTISRIQSHSRSPDSTHSLSDIAFSLFRLANLDQSYLLFRRMQKPSFKHPCPPGLEYPFLQRELERRYTALVEEWESKNGIAKGLVGLKIGWAGDMWRFERFEEYTRKIYEESKLKPQEDKRRKYICTLDAMLDLSTQFLELGLELLREENLISDYQAKVASYGSQCKAWLRWGVSGLVGESVPGWQSEAEEVVRLWLQRPVLEDQERDGVEVLGRARLVLAEGVRLVEGEMGN